MEITERKAEPRTARAIATAGEVLTRGAASGLLWPVDATRHFDVLAIEEQGGAVVLTIDLDPAAAGTHTAQVRVDPAEPLYVLS